MQIVHSSHRGSRDIEHIGSAHDDAELEVLKAAARQRLAAGQGELNLGPGFTGGGTGGPLPITSSRMGHLLDALGRGYDVLGFGRAASGDEVFRASGAGADHRAGQQAGLAAGAGGGRGGAGVVRHAQAAPAGLCEGVVAAQAAAACAAHARRWARPAWCSMTCPPCISRPTQGDGFREPGFSKERRLEPQITIGLLTDAGRVPADDQAFEGNKAETKTMLPVIDRVHDRPPAAGCHGRRGRGHDLRGQPEGDRGRRAVVHPWHADPGRPLCRRPVAARAPRPGASRRAGLHPALAGHRAQKAAGRRDKVIYYQYRADRARRTLRGIDEQVAKAEKAVAGKVPVKRNRFITPDRRHQER